MENGNEPISPCRIEGRQGYGGTPTVPNREVYGLTKREYFAALAMQGILSHEAFYERMRNEGGDNKMIDKVSVAAVKMADALLEELDKTK